MEAKFSELLATALVADYFLIMNLAMPDGDDEFQCQVQLAPSFAHLTKNLGIERDFYESHDGTWVKIIFTEPDGKERLEDYLNGFNQTYRVRGGVVLMPDIYAGEAEPKKELWGTYLGRIVKFFDDALEGYIHIPISDVDGVGMAYAVYSKEGAFQVVSMK